MTVCWTSEDTAISLAGGRAVDVDVTDVNTEQPDKKSIMMYIMCCYEALTAEKNPSGNVSVAWNKVVKF